VLRRLDAIKARRARDEQIEIDLLRQRDVPGWQSCRRSSAQAVPARRAATIPVLQFFKLDAESAKDRARRVIEF
jgi:adenylate kinase